VRLCVIGAAALAAEFVRSAKVAQVINILLNGAEDKAMLYRNVFLLEHKKAFNMKAF
jgi:hypothetical protein